MKMIALSRQERQFVNDAMTNWKWSFQLRGVPVPEWFNRLYDKVSKKTHSNSALMHEDGMWHMPDEKPDGSGMFLVTADFKDSDTGEYIRDTERWYFTGDHWEHRWLEDIPYDPTDDKVKLVAWTEELPPYVGLHERWVKVEGK